MNVQQQNKIKSDLTKKVTAIALASVLVVSFFGGNLMTLQAMAVTDNQAAKQTLRQTLQQDQTTYKQAVQAADLAYKQAVQTADLAHSQAVQDANDAYNQAAQDAKSAYNTVVSSAHGNAAIIGSAMSTRDQAIATAQTTKINAIVTADTTHDKAVNDAWVAHETTVYTSLATRDGNDGTAQSTFYTTIGNATLATRAQTIGQAHVTEDNSILQAQRNKNCRSRNCRCYKDSGSRGCTDCIC